MAVVFVTCRRCKRQLRLPREVIGSKVSCPMCKAVFVTRSTGDETAETLSVPEAPSYAPIDETGLLPLESANADGLPDLSLDEPEPPKKDSRRLLDPEPDNVPLRMIDDDPPRARPSAPPRRRPRDDDEEDRPRKRLARRVDDEPSPPRKRSGDALASFPVFIHTDPDEKLSGRFDCEADAEGLKVWRGQGRTLEVPLGSKVEYLGGGRLLLPLDGRKVELTPVHPDGMHDELAKEVSAYVEKRQDTLMMPVRPRGKVVWMALLPLGLPLLGVPFGGALRGIVGLFVWGVLGAILAAVCLLIVTRRNWAAGGRAWGATLVSLAGYFVLAIFGRFTGDAPSSALLPGPWAALAPLDGGFRVEMPGMPVKAQSQRFIQPWNLNEKYYVDFPSSETAFVLAYGDIAAAAPDQMLADAVRNFASHINGNVTTQRDRPLDGKRGVAFEIDTRERGRAVGRAYQHGSRVFFLAFGSKSLPTNCPEATRFLESFAFDPSTGWPGRRMANAPPPNVPPPPLLPPGPDQMPPGGKLLMSNPRPFVWAGLSPDGKLAAAVAEDNGVYFLDPSADQPPVRVGLSDIRRGTTAAFSPDGKTLLVPNGRGQLYVLDAASRRIAETRPFGGPEEVAVCVAYSANGKYFAVGRSDGKVVVWDIAERKEERTVGFGNDPIQSVAWLRDGVLLAGDAGGRVHRYDILKHESGGAMKVQNPALGAAEYALRGLAVTPDGRSLITGGSDRLARGWDAESQERRFQAAHPEPVQSVALFPGGRLFATGCADGVVRVYETLTGRPRGQVRESAGGRMRGDVVGLSFAPDGKLLVAVGDRLELWQVDRRVSIRDEDRKPLVPLPPNLTRATIGEAGYHSPNVGPLAISRDGSRVVFTGKDGKLRVWDSLSFKVEFETSLGAVNAVALSAAGEPAFGHGNQVRLRDGVVLGNASNQQVASLAFSPDGKRLAAGHSIGYDGPPGELVLWDLAAKSWRKFPAHRRAVSGVAFSDDGLTLVSVGAADPVVRLWDAAAGREYARLLGHAGGVNCVAAAPGGKLFATGGTDKTVKLWDAAAMRVARTLEGHTGSVNSVTFSQDGLTLASAGADRAVRLWDAASGALLHSIPYEADVTGIGFGPAGKTLLVRAKDGSLDRWDLVAFDALRNRPEPTKIDLDASPAPEMPDLQPGGTIAAPTALVVAPEKGCALAFTRDRQVLRYSYPEWKLTHAVLLRDCVLGAALDAEKGVLYAAVCDPRKMEFEHGGGWRGPADLAVIDVAAVLAGKEVPGSLKPAATVPLGVQVRDVCLADGGRWLYYLAERKPLVFQPERLDTQTRKPAGSVELPLTRATRLRASPDGKSLAALAVRENGPAVHLVVSIDPATAKLLNEIDLKATSFDFDLGSDGAVVCCAGEVKSVRLADGKANSWRATGGQNTPRISPDGKRLYLVRPDGVRVEVSDRRDDGSFDLSKPRAVAENAADGLLGPACWLTPDGKFLVGATGRVMRLSAAGIERPAAKEEAKAGGALPELPPWKDGHDGRVHSVAASPDGQLVASVGEDPFVLFRRPDSAAVVNKFQVERVRASAGLYSVAFAPGGRMSLAASWNGNAYAQTWPAGTYVGVRQGQNPSGLDAIAFLGHGRMAAASSFLGFKLWDAPPGGTVPGRLVGAKSALTGLAAHPTTGTVAAGGLDGKVYLFDTEQFGKEGKPLEGHAEEVRCVAYSPDGKYLVSGDVAGGVRVWDAESGKPVRALAGHTHAVMAVAVAPDAKLVAAGAIDGSLTLWKLDDGKLVSGTPARPGRPIYSLSFSPDGKVLYGAAGSLVRRWDSSGLVGAPLLRPGNLAGGPNVPPAAIKFLPAFRHAAFDPAGKQLLTVSTTGLQVSRYDYPEMQRRRAVRVERGVYRLALDGKGEKLYALRSAPGAEAEGAELLAFDLKDFRAAGEGPPLTPKPPAKLKLGGPALSLCVSPGGAALFYLDPKGRRVVKVDAATLKPAGEAKLGDKPSAMVLSPDGKTLVVAGENSLSRLDPSTMVHVKEVPLAFPPAAVAVSDAGKVAVCGGSGAEFAAALLDLAGGKPARTVTGREPMGVGLSADQKWFFVMKQSTGRPASGWAWNAADGRLVDLSGPAGPPRASAGQEVVAAPDGRSLLLNGGVVMPLPPEVAGK